MEWRWWLVLAVAVIVGIAALGKRWRGGRGRGHAVRDADTALAHTLVEWRAGERALVYFSGPGCSACQSQKHVLAQLEGVPIIERDALAQPDLAQAWGVRTLPTLLILSTQGAIEQRHSGFVPLHQLLVELAPPATLPPRPRG